MHSASIPLHPPWKVILLEMCSPTYRLCSAFTKLRKPNVEEGLYPLSRYVLWFYWSLVITIESIRQKHALTHLSQHAFTTRKKYQIQCNRMFRWQVMQVTRFYWLITSNMSSLHRQNQVSFHIALNVSLPARDVFLRWLNMNKCKQYNRHSVSLWLCK